MIWRENPLIFGNIHIGGICQSNECGRQCGWTFFQSSNFLSAPRNPNSREPNGSTFLIFCGWLNQPLWKICSSKWESSQRIGVKIKKKMKPPPSYFLLDSTVNFKQRDRAVSWNKRSPSKGGSPLVSGWCWWFRMVDRGVSSAYFSFQGPSKILTMKNKWKIFSSLSNCLGSSKHWKQQQEIRNKNNYIQAIRMETKTNENHHAGCSRPQKMKTFRPESFDLNGEKKTSKTRKKHVVFFGQVCHCQT